MERETRTIIIQILLFVATFITTTFAGVEWAYGKFLFFIDNTWSIVWNNEYTWNDFFSGMRFSVPFLLILTVHEFGHYFMAVYHRVKTSLPYYIPLPLPPGFFSIGTLGAVIRIRSRVFSNIQHFDIGLAGPLAGFIVALALLFYGFSTLPPAEYIYQFHPDYEQFGPAYADHVYTEEYITSQGGALVPEFGSNLLFLFFSEFVADPERVPNKHELMHYPLLMAGFIALFITSLNLLPIGQLDGGHIVYGLFGRRGHRLIATVFFILLLVYSGLGYVNVYAERDSLLWIVPLGIGFYYVCLSGVGMTQRDTLMYALIIVAVQLAAAWLYPNVKGYSGWLFFAFLVGRVLGVQHPPSEIEVPLTSGRKILGWISLGIFILCFSPAPLKLNMVLPEQPVEMPADQAVTLMPEKNAGDLFN